ncbi:MAG: relaxase/mobilization nuclease domain-containing protein [Clostridiales Family XIII bacterium]|nr:relaxase/mobilization nuclease domain-containing protein [Clostridiales Family XIII bacterium]
MWSVKGWLGKVVIYAENPDKTENPAYFEKQGMTEKQTQGLSDVIDYAAQSRKTQITNENAEILRHYVTGVNCAPETAREEMLAAKKKFGKENGVVAYHGIQSFAPTDNITPDRAHEIGVKLARRLWGDKYQVVVATHLDKANHLHSHFVVNTVSWVDGIRYHRTEQDYYNMQIESDKLCREYGLSVIEEPKRGKAKHYGEWQAEKDGKPTFRSLLKSDVDAAIAQSVTERQFWDAIRKMGYHVKNGKDITLRPESKEHGLKLCRNFGMEYSIEGIRKRILANTRPQRRIIPAEPPPKRIRVIGKLNTAKRITGLCALYFSYLHKMGVLPKRKEPNPRRVYFLFREDIRFIQNISRETRLLVNHKIDTTGQLLSHKDKLTNKIISLSSERKTLRYKSRSIRGEDKLAVVKAQISELSGKIGELRREVRLCEDIEKRSVDMKEKIHKAAEEQKSNVKEGKQHESFRGRR